MAKSRSAPQSAPLVPAFLADLLAARSPSGAEIVGPQAGELIHCFSGPLAMKATVHDLLRAPWYHPTLAEILTYPLEELAERIPAARG